ncbi:MAG: hypothetical protein ACRDX8_03410 [Acidimicrobiales bacterium]
MIHVGQVIEFDRERGLGTVRGDNGATLAFHCTAIADGSRSIPLGSQVFYEISPGPGARLWATCVTECPQQRPR